MVMRLELIGGPLDGLVTTQAVGAPPIIRYPLTLVRGSAIREALMECERNGDIARANALLETSKRLALENQSGKRELYVREGPPCSCGHCTNTYVYAGRET